MNRPASNYWLLGTLVAVEMFIAVLVYGTFGGVAYNGDALYEAQVARNVLAGKGYVTSEMPLYAVDLYQREGMSLQAPWTNTHKFLLPVLIKALLITAFGDNLASVTFIYSYIFHFLTVLTVYAVALRLWKRNYLFAFLSALVFQLNPILGFGTPYIMVSGLNLGVDAFLFMCLLYVLVAWWQTRRTWLLPVAGVISGVAFLDRYNSGLYICLVFLVLAWHAWREYRRHLQKLPAAIYGFVRSYFFYFLGFLVVACTLLLWNKIVTGHAFLSINGLFQLLFDTRYNSWIDPWYKIDYAFSTMNPTGFALAHPLPLLGKWLKYLSQDILRFAAFENVLWWTPLVVAYFAVRRRVADHEATAARRGIDFILGIVGILGLVQLLLLPLWAGSVAYFFYLFPPIGCAIAYVLYDLCMRARGGSRPDLTAGDFFAQLSKTPVSELIRRNFIVILELAALFLLSYAALALMLKPLLIAGYLVIIATICLMAAVVTVVWAKPKISVTLVSALILAYFIAETGIIGAQSNADILRSRWDLETNPNVVRTLERLNKGGISLSITPWNTVWWSHNAVSALPLPEYPDDIYLLASTYGLQVDSLYLNKINLYPFKYVPYTWSGYERAVRNRYGFDGYDPVERTEAGLILGRNAQVSAGLGMSRHIDIGSQSANSHLVWGWGANETDPGTGATYATAGPFGYLGIGDQIVQGTRADEKRAFVPMTVSARDIIVNAPGAISQYHVRPDAEVTFVSASTTRISVARIRVRSAADVRINMSIVLNGNLLYAEQPGELLGNYSIGQEWQTVEVPIDPTYMNDGINKISFVFAGKPVDQTEGYADFDYIDLLQK